MKTILNLNPISVISTIHSGNAIKVLK